MKKDSYQLVSLYQTEEGGITLGRLDEIEDALIDFESTASTEDLRKYGLNALGFQLNEGFVSERNFNEEKREALELHYINNAYMKALHIGLS